MGMGTGDTHCSAALTAASTTALGILAPYPSVYHHPGSVGDRAAQIRELLVTFEWVNGPDGNRIAVTDDGLSPNLSLYASVQDTYRMGHKINLIFKIPVDTNPPMMQIRHLIHTFVLHEADEGMVLKRRDGEAVRPYNPHVTWEEQMRQGEIEGRVEEVGEK